MFLRTALMSLLALACCQMGYGQYQTRGVVPSGANARSHRVVSHQAAAPATMPAATAGPQTTSHTLNYAAPTATYGMPSAHAVAPHASAGTAVMGDGMQEMMDPPVADETCDEGGCAPCTTNYVPWWHRHFVWSYWKIKGLPSPWCSPGNMSGHVPWCPCSGTYYYFRPYNWFHIPEHQQEAAFYEGDPRNPYDNRVVFDGLYGGLP